MAVVGNQPIIAVIDAGTALIANGKGCDVARLVVGKGFGSRLVCRKIGFLAFSYTGKSIIGHVVLLVICQRGFANHTAEFIIDILISGDDRPIRRFLNGGEYTVRIVVYGSGHAAIRLRYTNDVVVFVIGISRYPSGPVCDLHEIVGCIIAVRHRCIVRIGHLRKISCRVIAILDSIAVYIGIFDDPIKLIVFPCDSTIRVGCCEYITVFIVSVGSRSFRVGVSSDPAQCVVSKLGFLAPSVNQLRTKVERIVSIGFGSAGRCGFCREPSGIIIGVLNVGTKRAGHGQHISFQIICRAAFGSHLVFRLDQPAVPIVCKFLMVRQCISR